MRQRLNCAARDLGRDGQHGRAIQPGVRNPGNQVGGAGTESGYAQTWYAGHLADYLGHPSRAGFVTGEQESQAGSPRGVDKRDNFSARQTEGELDSARSEGLRHGFRVAGHVYLQ